MTKMFSPFPTFIIRDELLVAVMSRGIQMAPARTSKIVLIICNFSVMLKAFFFIAKRSRIFNKIAQRSKKAKDVIFAVKRMSVERKPLWL